MQGGEALHHGEQIVGLVCALFEACSLSDLVAEEVQLGAADLGSADDLDLLDLGRVDGKLPLDTDPEGDFANREGLTVTGTMPGNDHTLEDLDPLAGTFHNAIVDLDGVADLKGRKVVTDLLLLNGSDDIQFVYLDVQASICTSIISTLGHKWEV